ncbi:[LysW]-aminoadipate kinase [Sulfidibacter corallicola]|uniref:Acetylglutamate kinase n=1 Tax=Sulfidibacter corallicola TaxID=2818388 RepID=A0A8A4TQM7_SULCO|nr:[LysW]-aminoadipate kinase [Sulfidibacter corallicola]QTD51392.1 [LysW]-aminoadipate kinase [Sulfidibacter corallicola]
MLIVKIGGGAAMNLEGIARDLAALSRPAVLVLGANAARNDLAERLGTPIRTVTSVSGYSSVLTDDATMDLILMAYAGLRNKQMVALCQRHGVNAFGLTGIDGGLVRGRRNRGIKTIQDGRKMLLRDRSGKPQEINTELLHLLLDAGTTPVIGIPILDEHGIAINSENDDIVALLHASLQAEQVVQLIEAPGLLADADDPQSKIDELTPDQLAEWEGRVQGRMRRKLMALNKLLNAAPTELILADGRGEHPLADALAGKGTVVSCQPQTC